MRRSFIIVLFFYCYLFIGHKLNAQLNDTELKSVFIERFSRFMTWPDNSPDSSFVIAVWGNKEMLTAIEKTYNNRQILHLPVQVVYVEDIDSISNLKCHILYIGDCFKENVAQYAATYQANGSLVLGHEGQCLNLGATLSFIQRNGRILFSYNQESLDRNKVKISYKLLQLAQVN